MGGVTMGAGGSSGCDSGCEGEMREDVTGQNTGGKQASVRHPPVSAGEGRGW